MIWDRLYLFLLGKIFYCSRDGEEITPRGLAKIYYWEDKEEKLRSILRKQKYLKDSIAEKRFYDNRELVVINRLNKMADEGLISIKENQKRKVFTVLASKVHIQEKYKFRDKKTTALHVKERDGWIVFEI